MSECYNSQAGVGFEEFHNSLCGTMHINLLHSNAIKLFLDTYPEFTVNNTLKRQAVESSSQSFQHFKSLSIKDSKKIYKVEDLCIPHKDITNFDTDFIPYRM